MRDACKYGEVISPTLRRDAAGGISSSKLITDVSGFLSVAGCGPVAPVIGGESAKAGGPCVSSKAPVRLFRSPVILSPVKGGDRALLLVFTGWAPLMRASRFLSAEPWLLMPDPIVWLLLPHVPAARMDV